MLRLCSVAVSHSEGNRTHSATSSCVAHRVGVAVRWRRDRRSRMPITAAEKRSQLPSAGTSGPQRVSWKVNGKRCYMGCELKVGYPDCAARKWSCVHKFVVKVAAGCVDNCCCCTVGGPSVGSECSLRHPPYCAP